MPETVCDCGNGSCKGKKVPGCMLSGEPNLLPGVTTHTHPEDDGAPDSSSDEERKVGNA